MKKNAITLGFISAALLTLVGCGGGTPVTYSIVFNTIQGNALVDFKVELLNGKKVVGSGFTNNKGEVGIVAPAGKYTARVVGLENNYKFGDLTVTKDKTEYVFTAKTRMGDPYAPKKTHYQIGDIVYDFDCTIVEYEGTELKKKTIYASEYLEDHELLVLNNWATWCGPCKAEFPAMDEAYQQVKDKVALFAFSTDDTHEAVAKFKKENKLTFDMGTDDEVLDYLEGNRKDYATSLTQFFGTTAVPTTIIIDRYGTMINKYVGSLKNASQFTTEWNNYLGDDYDPAQWVKINKAYYDKNYAPDHEV